MPNCKIKGCTSKFLKGGQISLFRCDLFSEYSDIILLDFTKFDKKKLQCANETTG